MTFDEVLNQVLDLLQREGRVSYRALRRRFDLDEEYLEDLKAELIDAKQLAVDEDGKVLVWSGQSTTPAAPAPDSTRVPRRDCDAARACGARSGRISRPASPRPSRGTRHAPTRGRLPLRPWQALSEDGRARTGPCRAGRRRRVVSHYGHDVLAAPGGGCPGRGGEADGVVCEAQPDLSDDLDRIGLESAVATDKPCLFSFRLCDEQTVERILVVQR